MGTTQAQAANLYEEHKDVFENVIFTEISETSLLIEMNGEKHLVHLDERGVPTGVSTDSYSFDAVSLSQKGHPACGVALDVAQRLHDGGWAAAIALAIASGGLGAIILAILYGAGVHGFFDWLKRNCK